jgi:hypothetical protein
VSKVTFAVTFVMFSHCRGALQASALYAFSCGNIL